MLWQFLALLAVHWLGDFVLQTHWQAQNKSKNWEALTHHVLTYSAVLVVGTLCIFVSPSNGLPITLFVLCNGLLHFATDAITSRMTSRLYAQQRWHDFFVVVGFDQLIHQATLAATMAYFLGGP